MKRFYTLIALVAMMVPMGVRSQTTVSTFPYNEGFESGWGGWTIVDNDNDGNNWFRSDGTVDGEAAHGGDYCADSWSYDFADNAAVNPSWDPDNFLISPAIAVSST